MENPTTPIRLIVIGGNAVISGAIETQIDRNTIRYFDTPAAALDTVHDNPNALIAYGPAVFGAAATGQPARIGGVPNRTVLLISLYPFDNAPEDDPEHLVHQAQVAMRVPTVLCVTMPAGLNWRAAALAGRD